MVRLSVLESYCTVLAVVKAIVAVEGVLYGVGGR